jgi:hypothetical protein
MHRTLKHETTKSPAKDILQQQERFDAFVDEFNHVRLHEALDMRRPADVYTRSARPLPTTLPELDYAELDDVVRVTKNGYMTLGKNLVYVSEALGDLHVGITEQPDRRLLVTSAGTDLGFVDRSINRLIPL